MVLGRGVVGICVWCPLLLVFGEWGFALVNLQYCLLLASYRIDFRSIFSIRICFYSIIFVWKYKSEHGCQRNSFVAKILIPGIWLHNAFHLRLSRAFTTIVSSTICEFTDGMPLFDGCVNTAACARKIRITYGIWIYGFYLCVHTDDMAFPCSRSCRTLSDVVSFICGTVWEEEKVLVCTCRVFCTRR